MGATVVLGVRNTTAAEEVVKKIQAKHPGAKVVVGPSLDLISQDSVRQFAQTIDKQFSTLDILVNNAGVSFMTRYMTPEGVGGIAQVGLGKGTGQTVAVSVVNGPMGRSRALQG